MATSVEAVSAGPTGRTPALFSRWKAVLVALVTQALVLGYTFSTLLFHPGHYLIVDHYDGIKTYFSMASFLRQPLGDGLLLRGHNYPFGEYMYGLPLMSHKAARAVNRQAELLYSLLEPGGPSPELLARLDQRPVLVFLDSSYYDGRNNYYRELLKDRPDMLARFEYAADFIRAQHLRRLAHQGNWSLYEWHPKPAVFPAPAAAQ